MSVLSISSENAVTLIIVCPSLVRHIKSKCSNLCTTIVTLIINVCITYPTTRRTNELLLLVRVPIALSMILKIYITTICIKDYSLQRHQVSSHQKISQSVFRLWLCYLSQLHSFAVIAPVGIIVPATVRLPPELSAIVSSPPELKS